MFNWTEYIWWKKCFGLIWLYCVHHCSHRVNYLSNPNTDSPGKGRGVGLSDWANKTSWLVIEGNHGEIYRNLVPSHQIIDLILRLNWQYCSSYSYLEYQYWCWSSNDAVWTTAAVVYISILCGFFRCLLIKHCTGI